VILYETGISVARNIRLNFNSVVRFLTQNTAIYSLFLHIIDENGRK
jgi:hypothetical protein